MRRMAHRGGGFSPRAGIGVSAALIAAALASVPSAQAPASSAPPALEEMMARVFRAPQVVGSVLITRSDPFGGPDEQTSGRLWYLPGRGIRFRAEGRGREDLVLDRDGKLFLLYRVREKTVYRAAWDRAPARLRQLVAEPERFLGKDFHAMAERRVVGGVARAGFALRRAALGDSLPSVSVWIAGDPATGLPRWLTAYSEDDSLRIEFRGLRVLETARGKDLELRVPSGTREQPLDPRDLLPGGESR